MYMLLISDKVNKFLLSFKRLILIKHHLVLCFTSRKLSGWFKCHETTGIPGGWIESDKKHLDLLRPPSKVQYQALKQRSEDPRQAGESQEKRKDYHM